MRKFISRISENEKLIDEFMKRFEINITIDDIMKWIRIKISPDDLMSVLSRR